MSKEQPKKPATHEPEHDAKKKAADQPTRDDVHEQREPVQEREGVVHPSGASSR